MHYTHTNALSKRLPRQVVHRFRGVYIKMQSYAKESDRSTKTNGETRGPVDFNNADEYRQEVNHEVTDFGK
jgi:hypothetical protein